MARTRCLGGKPAVLILMAGPLCFLMKRMRRIRCNAVACASVVVKIDGAFGLPRSQYPSLCSTVATLRCSPSNSSNEAGRLAKTGLEATIWDLVEMRSPFVP